MRLQRERLSHRLSGPRARLYVIEAPGGYGKSTLLYDALRSAAIAPAWYNVSENERDASAFLTHVMEALDRAYPGVCARTQAMHASPDPPPVRHVVTALINELMLHPDDEMDLVLDDVHLAAGAADVAGILEELAVNGPPHLRLYLTTRESLRLPVARLRSQHKAVTIGAEELLLTRPEVAALFAQVWEQPLDDEALDVVVEKSGGWITGLVLIRLTTEYVPAEEVDSVVRGMSGSHHYVFSYLSEEILQRQPPDLQAFLKDTSILDNLDPAAAEAVTDNPRAGAILDDLHHRGLFVVCVDPVEKRYRYHHLFGGFLLEALEKEVGRARLRERHMRAARWYRDRDVSLAIHHSLLAEEWADATSLLAEHGNALLQRGWHRRIQDWLKAVPETSIEANPRLLLVRGVLEDLTGDWVQAVASYELALNRFSKAQDPAGLAEALERMAVCLGRYGDWERVCKFVADAHRHCGQDDIALRARILAWEGANMTALGHDYGRAYELLRESYVLAQKAANPEAMASACFTYGFLGHMARGTFEAGARILQEGIELFEQLQNPYIVLHMTMNRVVLAWLQGDLDQADELLVRSDALGVSFEGSFAMLAQTSNRAKIALERGDIDACGRHLKALHNYDVPWQLRPWYLRTLLLYHARRGNVSVARAAEKQMLDLFEHQGRGGVYAPECLLALSAAHAWRKELSAACQHAQEAMQVARAGHMSFWQMKASYWLAWLGTLGGSDPDALCQHLDEALRITHESGYERFWVNDFLGVSVRLLVRAVAAGVHDALARNLISQMGERGLNGLLDIVKCQDTGADCTIACRLLGEWGDPRVVALLKQKRRGKSEAVAAAAADALRHVTVEAGPMELRTLGGLHIMREGVPDLNGGRSKAIQLLKLLLSQRDLAVRVEEAIAYLWPEASAEKGRHNVRMSVKKLRDLLNPIRGVGQTDYVVYAEDSYRLDISTPVAVDWVLFEQRVAEGDANRRRGNGRDAARLYGHAVDLYRGEFLPDDPCEEWTMAQRDWLRAAHRRCLSLLGDLHTERGDHAEAVRWYNRVLAEDRTNEAACQSVLRAYVALGDHASALRAYHELRETLWQELAVRPMAETQGLVRELTAS